MTPDLATPPPVDNDNIDRPMISFADARANANGTYRHAEWCTRILLDPKALRWTNDTSDYSRRKP